MHRGSESGCEVKSVVVNTSIVDFPLLSFTLMKLRAFLQMPFRPDQSKNTNLLIFIIHLPLVL